MRAKINFFEVFFETFFLKRFLCWLFSSQQQKPFVFKKSIDVSKSCEASWEIIAIHPKWKLIVCCHLTFYSQIDVFCCTEMDSDVFWGAYCGSYMITSCNASCLSSGKSCIKSDNIFSFYKNSSSEDNVKNWPKNFRTKHRHFIAFLRFY